MKSAPRANFELLQLSADVGMQLLGVVIVLPPSLSADVKPQLLGIIVIARMRRCCVCTLLSA